MKKMMILTAALFAFGAFAQELENPEIKISYRDINQAMISNYGETEDTEKLEAILFNSREKLCVNEVLAAATEVATSAEVQEFISKGYEVEVHAYFWGGGYPFPVSHLSLKFTHDSLLERYLVNSFKKMGKSCSEARESMADFKEDYDIVNADYEEYSEFRDILDDLNNVQNNADTSSIADYDRGYEGENLLRAPVKPLAGSEVIGF